MLYAIEELTDVALKDEALASVITAHLPDSSPQPSHALVRAPPHSARERGWYEGRLEYPSEYSGKGMVNNAISNK